MREERKTRGWGARSERRGVKRRFCRINRRSYFPFLASLVTCRLSLISFSSQLYKDMELDPYLKYESHAVANFFSSVSEPDYNYSERQLERSPVSDEEATKRAFYAVVWPEFLKRGWRESEGGDFVSPYVRKFDVETNTMDSER